MTALKEEVDNINDPTQVKSHLVYELAQYVGGAAKAQKIIDSVFDDLSGEFKNEDILEILGEQIANLKKSPEQKQAEQVEKAAVEAGGKVAQSRDDIVSKTPKEQMQAAKAAKVAQDLKKEITDESNSTERQVQFEDSLVKD